MRLHPAGYGTILISLTILLLVNLALVILIPLEPLCYAFFIVPTLVLIVLILRFFRYPRRSPSCEKMDSVLAPADGVVVVIEQVHDDRFFKGPAIQISTFMSPYNVHLNWVPIDAIAEEVVYMPGKYLLARNPKSSMLNEMACVSFMNAKGQRVVVKQIAGIVARRILPFLKSGNTYKKGDELGFIRFGSRVDVLLPTGSQVNVKIGDKVKGLETILAKLS
jgi:phosphatidylserine decarboxylase